MSGLTDLVSNFKHPAPMAMLNNGANLPVHIFQYSLESYSEERSTKWKKVPYPGKSFERLLKNFGCIQLNTLTVNNLQKIMHFLGQ